jgi:hypothetical protein
VGEHTFDHIERAFAASSTFSSNSSPNNAIQISTLDLTIGPQGSSIAESAFLPGSSNQTGGGNNGDASTVRIHGDQASIRVYGSNDNASHPSDEDRDTDLDTAAVLEYLQHTTPSITLNFAQLLHQSSSANWLQNSNDEEEDAMSSISNSSISPTLEQLLLNCRSLSDDIKKQLMATAISTDNEMLLKCLLELQAGNPSKPLELAKLTKELLTHAEKHKVQELKYEENAAK